MDLVYNQTVLLQLRYDRRQQQQYEHDKYEAAQKADTHDYRGTAGYKIVITSLLVLTEGADALVKCREWQQECGAPPHQLSFDLPAVVDRDGQVRGCPQTG